MATPALAVTLETDTEEMEYALMRAWASTARTKHAVERQERWRRRAARRAWLGRLTVTLILAVLFVLAWYRIASPVALVQLQEGVR